VAVWHTPSTATLAPRASPTSNSAGRATAKRTRSGLRSTRTTGNVPRVMPVNIRAQASRTRAVMPARCPREPPSKSAVRVVRRVRLDVLGPALGPHLAFLTAALELLEDHRALCFDACALPDLGVLVVEVDALAGAALEPVHGLVHDQQLA